MPAALGAGARACCRFCAGRGDLYSPTQRLQIRILQTEVGFVSAPREAGADTDTSTGRLMIAVLGGLADVERDLIRTRTAEGRSRAKARGKRFSATRRDHE